MKQRFALGQVVVTSGVQAVLAPDKAVQLIMRHGAGDWGDVCKSDAKANDYAINHNERVLSAYEIDSREIFVITEWDRSVTTLLLPSEY